MSDGITHHMRLVGQNIRARRQWAGLTLRELGQVVSVVPQHMHKYEAGLTPLRTFTLMRFAEALNSTPHELLGWVRPAADPDFEAAALFADPAVSSIINRLRSMDTPRRKLAHALICTLDAKP